MTPGNRAGVGKSRRGPGRRLSRPGWRPLLFRDSRYFTDSTGGAAGKGFAEEIFKAVSPVVSPEGVFGCFGAGDGKPVGGKRHQNSYFSIILKNMAGRRLVWPAGMRSKPLAGKNFVFGRKAEKLKRPTGARTG